MTSTTRQMPGTNGGDKMNPTANPDTSHQTANPPDIKIDRDVLESSLETFRNHVASVRERQGNLFKTLEDLLPQLVAAKLENELTYRARTIQFSLLQKLSSAAKPKLQDGSLAVWLTEELPNIIDLTKSLTGDYFEELVRCFSDIAAARQRLFSAFSIHVAESQPEFDWNENSRHRMPTFPVFVWNLASTWRYALLFPQLRPFVVRICQARLMREMAVYCDRLIRLARQAALEWLSDMQWQVEHSLADRSDIWVVSAEIVELLRQEWRGRTSQCQSIAPKRQGSPVIPARIDYGRQWDLKKTPSGVIDPSATGRVDEWRSSRSTRPLPQVCIGGVNVSPKAL